MQKQIIVMSSLITMFMFGAQAQAETYVTPYGQLIHRPSRNIGVNLDTGTTYYRTSSGAVVSPDGDYYAKRVGNNIFTTNGVGVRFQDGYLAPNGRYFPNSVPNVVLGGSPHGRSRINTNDLNDRIYQIQGAPKSIARSPHDMKKRSAALNSFYAGLPGNRPVPNVGGYKQRQHSRR